MPGDAEKQKAKAQAQRLVGVNGILCTLHVGAITYFRNDAIEFYWRDPEPGAREPIQLPNPEFAWRTYYEPFVEVIRSRGEHVVPESGAPALVPIEELDLRLGIHRAIASILLASNWQRARAIASETGDEFVGGGFQPDGLLVKAGPSWFERLEAG